MTKYGGVFIERDFEEIIVPSLWETQTFVDKAGPEIVNQMYRFPDKKGRDICLIPEVTGLIQEMWNKSWSKEKKDPYKIFYVQRCYRYERPQKGRYREFTQVGVEILSRNPKDYVDEAKWSLRHLMADLEIKCEFVDLVKRGLSYYVEDGFEVIAEDLGAQKQIAGGGLYKEGVGWAIGVDRVLLLEEKA